jgi:hypothetical protein
MQSLKKTKKELIKKNILEKISWDFIAYSKKLL